MTKFSFTIFFLLLFSYLEGASPQKVRTLYNSLDGNSLAQQLAFYDLYPSSPQGQQAIRNVYTLLNKPLTPDAITLDRIPATFYVLNSLIALVNKPPETTAPSLSDKELQVLESLANFLPNRKLKGFWAKSEREVLALPAEEIDIARGLLLSELGSDLSALMQIRTYEATLDLMAMQILCKVGLDSTPQAKIRAINELVYWDMGFRYPAHSTYAKEIDLYSFLPSVLDSRKGVCLGVALLYLALAQRLDLPLEIVTPPGHIYVRYHEGNRIVNIETTARGVHLDCKRYLSIHARSLQTRTMKEAVGSAHFNQAAVFWQSGQYEKAITSYRHALQYIPDDALIKEFLAYNLLLNGNEEEGMALLREIQPIFADYLVTKDTIVDDILAGRTDASGLKAIFMQVDETHDSLTKKRQAIEKVVEQFPTFRAGWFNLAISWLQLQREGEALIALERYHALDSNDATAEYYLAALYAQRFDYNKAWGHLEHAEKLAKARNHSPECLEDLRRELAAAAPKKETMSYEL